MKKIDWWLVIPMVLLSSLGLLILRSAAVEVFWYQLGFMAVGAAIFVLVAAVDYKISFAFWLWEYGLSIILLIISALFGVYTRGSVRWIPIGSISLQTSELIKPLILIFLAVLLHIKVRYSSAIALAAGVVPVYLILRQPDLGTAMVLAVGCLTMVMAKLPLKKTIISLGLALVVLGPLAWVFMHGYQKQRLQTFINPYADPQNKGYHVIQSVIAVGSGKLWGRGLGRGTQSQLRFLPEHHTDFIFASLAEELGLAGSGIVLILYFILLWRINSLIVVAPDLITKSYLRGVWGMLAFQIFVNIGMNLGMVPVTGITLPFLSYGGSSLLSLMITLGLVQSISSKIRINRV